jgi:hypothetical protein
MTACPRSKPAIMPGHEEGCDSSGIARPQRLIEPHRITACWPADFSIAYSRLLSAEAKIMPKLRFA